jgi:hypothetical protein
MVARQDAARKYSAAFEGHKNIVAPNLRHLIVMSFINIPFVDCRQRWFDETFVKQRYSMCDLLPNSIALTKIFRFKIQRRRLPVTNQLVKEVLFQYILN